MPHSTLSPLLSLLLSPLFIVGFHCLCQCQNCCFVVFLFCPHPVSGMPLSFRQPFFSCSAHCWSPWTALCFQLSSDVCCVVVLTSAPCVFLWWCQFFFLLGAGPLLNATGLCPTCHWVLQGSLLLLLLPQKKVVLKFVCSFSLSFCSLSFCCSFFLKMFFNCSSGTQWSHVFCSPFFYLWSIFTLLFPTHFVVVMVVSVLGLYVQKKK